MPRDRASVEVEVAAGLDPLIVMLGEDGSDEPDEGGAIGEEPDDVFCTGFPC